MKTNSIQSYNISVKPSNKQQNVKRIQHVAFKGNAATSGVKAMGGVLPWFMNKIENGGFFLEFVILDLCGLVIPRTVQAFNRNKEQLGGLNIVAGTEEFLREALTGPSMFLIPLGALALAGKLTGRGSQINVKTLRKFTDVFKKTAPKIKDMNALKMQREFTTSLFNETFKEHVKIATKNGQTQKLDEFRNQFTELIIDGLDKTKKETKGKFVELVAKIHKSFTNPQNTMVVEWDGVKKSGIEKMFEKISKKPTANEDFGKHAISVGDFFVDAVKYTSDIVPTTRETIKELASQKTPITEKIVTESIDAISNMREGARKLSTLLGVASVGAFLCIMPKIYQLSKTNPGVKGLDNKGEVK